MAKRRINIAHQTVELSNTGKILFPRDGITKGDLVEYYRRVSALMLPHLEGHPIMMERFPEGLDQPGFLQKEVSDNFPDWIHRVTIGKDGARLTHMICNTPAALVYLANEACISIHMWLSRVDRLNNPDWMIFDLDPPEDGFDVVATVAKILHDMLQQLGMTSYLMTTGSNGLHVVTPLDGNENFDDVGVFAGNVAQILADENPDFTTIEQRKDRRDGRVYIDITRNSYGGTMVAPYSVRAVAGAPVAKPIYWSELNDREFHPRMYTLRNVSQWLNSRSDPWSGILRHARSLKEPRQVLKSMLIQNR